MRSGFRPGTQSPDMSIRMQESSKSKAIVDDDIAVDMPAVASRVLRMCGNERAKSWRAATRQNFLRNSVQFAEQDELDQGSKPNFNLNLSFVDGIRHLQKGGSALHGGTTTVSPFGQRILDSNRSKLYKNYMTLNETTQVSTNQSSARSHIVSKHKKSIPEQVMAGVVKHYR